LRPSCDDIMKQLLDTGYIDAKLKDLSYEHLSHIVQLKYGEPNNEVNDHIVIFKDCFTAEFNTWLDGMEGTVPQKPSELDFFFHNIEVEDVEINGIQLYRCSMVIPMMDCKVSCLTIDIKSPS
jgi:hypothetical protein